MARISKTVGGRHPRPTTISDLLRHRAEETPGGLAFRFLTDGESTVDEVSYSQLLEDAKRIASGLLDRQLAGEPILIAAPPGRSFAASIFGAWLAGAIAVPAYPARGSRHRARLEAMRTDSGATVCLGDAPSRPIEGLRFIDPLKLEGDDRDVDAPLSKELPSLLQYTSGSTESPKGVALHHEALIRHLDRIHETLQPREIESLFSWLPPYHDMGLVLKFLYSLRAGLPLTWMSPDHFVQKPARWLRAIDRYRAHMSGGPNFALEWCLRSVADAELEGLDLSCWSCAPIGAERVRRDTLERFAQRFERCGFDPEAFCPGYGLAEATLVVTSHCPGQNKHWRVSKTDPDQVSCGRPMAGTSIRVVDQDTREELEEGRTGEIEIASESLADGYWNHPVETAEVFHGSWLRSGDLGFVEEGELFIVGRIKDMMVIDGVNVSPEDIEALAIEAEPELTALGAFPIESARGESIGLAIEAGGLAKDERQEFCSRLRLAVAARGEFTIQRILLVRPGLLPRTTSGKIQRHRIREAYERGELPLLFDDGGPSHQLRPSSSANCSGRGRECWIGWLFLFGWFTEAPRAGS